MTSFLSRLSFRFGHVSDETLANFLSGELNSLRTVRVSTHLNRCWQCRARRDELERAALLVVEYRRGNQASCLPLDPGRRRSFLAKVEETVSMPGFMTHRPNLIYLLPRSLRIMNPAFASVVIVAVAGVLLFWIWQRASIAVSAHELIRRAEVSEQQHSAQHPTGVLYQQVAVRAGKSTIRRSIYRDLSGQRLTRAAIPTPTESEIRRTLESVGVDWDEPLSAKGFRGWHDRQVDSHDAIERTGQSELTLTTTLNDGDVAQESLTVRESDFHPIRRVVETRSQETIEVAELDYAVLGWSAVNQALFEPLVSVEPLAPSPSLHAALPRLRPTPMEIDIAELSARAALAQLAAEAGDQVRITHNETGVAVKGIVTTDQRKRQLLARLDAIPFVRTEFLSTEEMGRLTDDTSGVRSSVVQMYTASETPAPLTAFLNDRHGRPDQLSAASQQLLDASLQVQQAGAQLLELQDRFALAANLPEASRTQLESLIALQQKGIESGLNAEMAALSRVGLANSDVSSAQAQPELLNRALFRQRIAQNQRYCQELIAAPVEQARPASAIAADIQTSIREIRATLRPLSESSPQP